MKQDFNDESTKVADPNDFPRFKLQQVGEYARILCIEAAPEMAFVHTLRAPMLDEQGNVMKEERKGKRGPYFVTKRAFVGQHLCFGKPEILVKDGKDPENCITCQAAVEEEGIEAPDRRYAMHVLQYAVKPGTAVPVDPLSIQTRVWTFAASKFNELHDLNSTWKNAGGIRVHDMIVGPLEPPVDMQKAKIQVTPEVAHCLSTPAHKAIAAETYKNNRCADLVAMIARQKTTDQVRDDIAQVLDKVAIANGKKAPTAPTTSAGADVDVAGILDGVDAATAPTDTQPDPALAGLDMDAMFDKAAPVTEPVPTPTATAEQPAAPPVAEPTPAPTPPAETPNPMAPDADDPESVFAAASTATASPSGTLDFNALTEELFGG